MSTTRTIQSISDAIDFFESHVDFFCYAFIDPDAYRKKIADNAEFKELAKKFDDIFSKMAAKETKQNSQSNNFFKPDSIIKCQAIKEKYIKMYEFALQKLYFNNNSGISNFLAQNIDVYQFIKKYESELIVLADKITPHHEDESFAQKKANYIIIIRKHYQEEREEDKDELSRLYWVEKTIVDKFSSENLQAIIYNEIMEKQTFWWDLKQHKIQSKKNDSPSDAENIKKSIYNLFSKHIPHLMPYPLRPIIRELPPMEANLETSKKTPSKCIGEASLEMRRIK